MKSWTTWVFFLCAMVPQYASALDFNAGGILILQCGETATYQHESQAGIDPNIAFLFSIDLDKGTAEQFFPASRIRTRVTLIKDFGSGLMGVQGISLVSEMQGAILLTTVFSTGYVVTSMHSTANPFASEPSLQFSGTCTAKTNDPVAD